MIRGRVAIAIGTAIAFFVAGVVVALQFTVRFGEPSRLWAAATPVALAWLWLGYLVWRGWVAEQLGRGETVRSMLASWSGRLQTTRMTLLLMGTLLVAVSVARPQWGERPREVTRKGIDVVFALDISRSMLADDVTPSRLDAATAELDRLLGRLEGDRVGLVVFAGIAFVQTPLTSDYGAIRLYLDRLHPDDLEIQGTAIGRSLTESHRLLTGGTNADEFERADNQLVVLISDGEDHVGDPVEAARELQADGIEVFSVGIGTEEGSRIPLRSRSGTVSGYLEDRRGNVVTTTLAEDQLMAIAEAGGAAYHRYTGEGSIAEPIDSAIAEYDDEALASMLRTEYEDRFLFFLVPGALLVFASLLLGDRRKRSRLVATATAAVLFVGTGCGDTLLRPDPRVEEAVALAGSGEGSGALETLDRVGEEARVQPAFQYASGWIHEQLSDFDDAQTLYVRALNAQTEAAQVDALVALGNVLMARERYETAIERFRRALVLDPTNDAARRNLEIALLRLFPPCAELDDEFEDADDAASAAQLPAAVYGGPYLPPGIEQQEGTTEEAPDLVSCGTDEDWYAVPVVGGSTLDVEVEFSRLRDDTGGPPPPAQIPPTSVRVALIDVDGVTPLAVDQGLETMTDGATTVGGDRVTRSLEGVQISTGAPDGSFAYLKIVVDDPLEYEYEVSITLTPPCWALEDEYESNDLRRTATETDTARLEARICADNEDWYRVPVDPVDALFVDVSPVTTDTGEIGSLEVQMFVNDEPEPRQTQRVGAERPLAAFAIRDATEVQEAVFRVRGVDEVEGAYRVDVHRFPPCPEGRDRYEANDRPQERTALDPNEAPYRHLRLCPGDEDWFEYPLPEIPEEDREGQPERPFSALVEFEEPVRDFRVRRPPPVAGAEPNEPEQPSDRAVNIYVYEIGDRAGSPVAEAAPVRTIAPASVGPVPDAVNGVAAATTLDWETEAVAVRVYGEPGFYHLSFPLTQQQQQQQQQQQESEEQEDSEESEEEQEGESEPQEQEQEDGEEPEDQEDSESAEEAQTDEEQEAQAAEPTNEEQEREMLLRLLDSLEPEDVNLPLQQALENAPPQRMQEEW